MSRAYRITVKESETRLLEAGDEICTQLEILDILPPEAMAKLLVDELTARGFEEREEGAMVREDGNLTVTVDPCSGTVTVSSQTQAEVSQEAKRDATGFNDVGPTEGTLRDRVSEQLKHDIEKKFEHEQGRLQITATEQLEKHLQELQPEIAEIVNKITRDALKEKAQQMGTVTEISEDPVSGSLTIKLEV